MKCVLESPCSAKTLKSFDRNRRYALWCCHVLARNGHDVFASYVSGPLYLDDRDPRDRARGMHLTEAFTDDTCVHVFATDLAMSEGMTGAPARFPLRSFGALSLKNQYFRVPNRDGIDCIPLEGLGDAWAAFERGESPPCTPGYGVAAVPRDIAEAPVSDPDGTIAWFLAYNTSLAMWETCYWHGSDCDVDDRGIHDGEFVRPVHHFSHFLPMPGAPTP